MGKIYQKTLINFSVRKIPFQKGVSGEYRLSIRSGKDVFILSNPTASGISPAKFSVLESKLFAANLLKKPITIKFIKHFSKKFIQDIS